MVNDAIEDAIEKVNIAIEKMRKDTAEMKKTNEQPTIDLEEMRDFLVLGQDKDGNDVMVASRAITVQRMGALLGTLLSALMTEASGLAVKRLNDEK